jgi:ribonuclease R
MKKDKLIKDLLELFNKSSLSLKLNEIAKSLKIKSDSDEYLILKDILNDLAQKLIVEKSPRRKYRLIKPESESAINGILKIKNEKGIIETDFPELPIITIKLNHLNTALDGDYVQVQLHAEKPGKKPRGEVLQVLERNNPTVVGTINFNGYFYFLIPDDEKYYVDFLIPEQKLNGAKAGDKVIADFLSWDDPSLSPTVSVKEIMGKAGLPVVEYDSIIKEFDLPQEFPEDVISEANTYRAPINRKPKGRLDLRDKLIITIDPPDAKDFDDALSLEVNDHGNYILGVHIADVSHYVKENSSLDIEARFRGNSIYLVDRVVPMLPEELSNEICSLKPNVPRLTFSVFMEITPKGVLEEYHITESIIINKRRYNYDEVLEIIETGIGDNSEFIIQLHKLTEILRAKRFKSGGINFETQEYKFVLDENKYPIDVIVKQTTKSTSLVEECMLMANQCVANNVKKISDRYLILNPLPFLYRVHEDPDPKKISEVLAFISTFGPKLNKKKISSKEINKLLEFFEDKPEKTIVNQVLIRSMSKAVYQPKNIGHYGLGFSDYSHFTSPIRRYPDLVVHRLLKEYAQAKPDTLRINYLRLFVKDAGQHCTNTERLAMEAERASNKFTFAVMAHSYIGEEFNGTITGVTSFGLFVQIEKIFCEGLLHMRDLKDDYYVYDETRYCLIGRRHKKVYEFGKKIRVKIIRVNVDKRNIDLAYIDDQPSEE